MVDRKVGVILQKQIWVRGMPQTPECRDMFARLEYLVSRAECCEACPHKTDDLRAEVISAMKSNSKFVAEHSTGATKDDDILVALSIGAALRDLFGVLTV